MEKTQNRKYKVIFGEKFDVKANGKQNNKKPQVY